MLGAGAAHGCPSEGAGAASLAVVSSALCLSSAWRKLSLSWVDSLRLMFVCSVAQVVFLGLYCLGCSQSLVLLCECRVKGTGQLRPPEKTLLSWQGKNHFSAELGQTVGRRRLLEIAGQREAKDEICLEEQSG